MAVYGSGDRGDHLVQALLADGQVRAMAAVTTRTVEEARWRHDLSPTAAAALGRTLTVTAFLGAMLKAPQKVSVEIVCDGPIKALHAQADAEGRVRGYVDNPHVDLPVNARGKLDVAGAVGHGTLYVIRDLGLREPYRGFVPLVSGEIGEDFAYYFLHSEQTPSVVAVGVLVDPDHRVRAAGGLLLQVMPGASEEVISVLEQRARELPPMSSAVDQGKDAEGLLALAAGDLDVRVLRRLPVQFKCSCSRERFERALVALGEEELRDMLETDGSAELVCHFCSEVYRFDAKDLAALLKAASYRQQ
ncbi:MAG: Hsp33 family molecular chaperone HslO [Bacillota bacterium]|nr:Hsp33 family molecular chaperone HslO [Bacillota bacterium]REJ37113.1 MAG: Hsp33 family molecular chaperone HslO [Bacillota bacterium]